MRTYIKKFSISSIPLIMLIAAICIFTDAFIKELIISEFLSYTIIEWIVIFTPPIGIAYLRPKNSVLLGIVTCAFLTFNCDVFRSSNDIEKDIDIVFYFGAFFRAFAISCICFPILVITAQYGKNRRASYQNS
jgi:predicted secreted protein